MRGLAMDFLKRIIRSSSMRQHQEPEMEQETKEQLSVNLEQNIQKVKSDLGNSTDIVFRELSIGCEIKIGLIYTSGLADTQSIQSMIIDSLTSESRRTEIVQRLASNENAVHII